VSSTYRFEKIPLFGSNSWVVVIIGREVAGEEEEEVSILLLLLLLLLPVIQVLEFRVRSNK